MRRIVLLLSFVFAYLHAMANIGDTFTMDGDAGLKFCILDDEAMTVELKEVDNTNLTGTLTIPETVSHAGNCATST